MDISSLARELTVLLIPFLPYLVKMGDAAAEEGGKKLAGEAWERVKNLWSTLHPKLNAKPAAQDSVHRLSTDSQDERAQLAFREQIEEILREDAKLSGELERLWKEAQPGRISVATVDDRSVTIAGGAEGNVIVTGDHNVVQHGQQNMNINKAVGSAFGPGATVNVNLPAFPHPGSAPPLPTLFIGREGDVTSLKTRLGIASAEKSSSPQILTAVRGWPGIGKTTLAAALAHDPQISDTFPDGVLWTSLGPNPNVLSELATWGRALGTDDLLRARTVEEAAAQLRALLRNKRMLLIIDDVWEHEHAVPFMVGGRDCATLITTRLNQVANKLAPTPNDVYRLMVLTEDKSLELLRALAPTVATEYPEESRELVREIEGLPLALQVAGHLLNAEASLGFGVSDLIRELREGTKLLEAQAPADRTDLANETTPTVAVLLQRSTNRLDSLTRDCFAYLGAFAAKPATFDEAAMKAVWGVEDPKPTIRTLVDRGLLEPVPTTGRFQMHALLVMHAKSLLTED